VPLYSYRCETCDASLEVLHGMNTKKELCGLSCQRRDSGPFGKGTINRVLTAANVVARRAIPTGGRPTPTAPPDDLRQKALERLGGDQLTEGEITKAKKGGLTVYRNSGAGTFVRDGGDASLPKHIKKPEESS
jgi:putative FmdB family regulatory protein